MTAKWDPSASRRFVLVVVSVVFTETCSAQAPPPTATASSPASYHLGAQVETSYSFSDGILLPSGVRTLAVTPGSPAQRSGIRPGDILTVVNGQKVTSPESLRQAMANSGGQITIVGQNAGTGITFEIKGLPLASLPVSGTAPHPNFGVAPTLPLQAQFPDNKEQSTARAQFDWSQSTTNGGAYWPQTPAYGQNYVANGNYQFSPYPTVNGQNSMGQVPTYQQGPAMHPPANGEYSWSQIPAYGQGNWAGAPAYGQGYSTQAPVFGSYLGAQFPAYGQGNWAGAPAYGQSFSPPQAPAYGGANWWQAPGGYSGGMAPVPGGNNYAPQAPAYGGQDYNWIQGPGYGQGFPGTSPPASFFPRPRPVPTGWPPRSSP